MIRFVDGRPFPKAEDFFDFLADMLRDRFLNKPLDAKHVDAVRAEVFGLLHDANHNYRLCVVSSEFWHVGLAKEPDYYPHTLHIDICPEALRHRKVEITPHESGGYVAALVSAEDLFVRGPSPIEALVGLAKAYARRSTERL